MTAVLEARGLSKRFPKGDRELVALRDFDLAITPGSFVVILGRSGCGKSTFLNVAAGLMAPSDGQILYRGAPVTRPRAEVGYLTQSDTLMPWRDVLRNVEMPLEIRGIPRERRRAAALELVNLVGLTGFERHYPRELSGGMRRRTSLARMLSTDPETLLLDEPFAALDAQLRGDLQRELLRLWEGSGRTVVFVTHDLEEALLLGDRIVVLGPLGRVIEDIAVDLPRPRDPDSSRIEHEFIVLHATLSHALKEAARWPRAEASA